MKIIHALPWGLGVGGAENHILNLCKYGDRTETKQSVVAIKDGPMRREIEQVGAPVYILNAYSELFELFGQFDLINLHWSGYERFTKDFYLLILATMKSHITTLHWLTQMPDIPALTVCVSDHLRQIQANPEKFRMISSGIDLERFHPRPKQPREKIILTRVCRPEKCHEYFWDGIDRVLVASRKNIEIWVVGEDGESTDQVKFMGIRRDVPDILAQTDVFVYTPWPKIGANDVVVMEAMAMGVPCVVSDVECVRESITHMYDGLLTPFGNTDAFADAILMLIRDRDLREKMGQNATKTAVESFDIKKKALQYEELYRLVLNDTLTT